MLCTGGVAALTFGQIELGEAPSTLLRQRRAVAAAAAPSSGASGQSLELALMRADGSATGKVDSVRGTCGAHRLLGASCVEQLVARKTAAEAHGKY